MMNRILKRPMFRMGGRSDDGIMSLRPGYAIGDKVKGFGSKSLDLLKSGIGRLYNLFPEEGLLTKGAKGFQTLQATSPNIAAASGTALSTLPLAATIAGQTYMNAPVYPKGHPKEGEFMPIDEAREVMEKTGGAVNIATGKGTQAGGAGDIEGEAAMFDLETGDYPNKKYATKLDFESPEVLETSRELNLLPKKDDTSDKSDKGGKVDDGLGDDGTSDFERSLNEYLPAIESALQIDDEATKRQLFLQLAKFGAGLIAQPGGDLTGAIGRAALDPIEGVGKALSDKQAAKRQAKLIAVEAAIKDMGPGSYGKNVQDIMKTFDLKGKEGRKQAGQIYNKILANDSTALSRDRDDLSNAAREDLRLKGGAIDAYVNNIRAIRESNPELIGKFNKVITSDDKPDDQEYYVTEEGEFVRYDKETDSFLQPGEEGFTNSKTKKK